MVCAILIYLTFEFAVPTWTWTWIWTMDLDLDLDLLLFQIHLTQIFSRCILWRQITLRWSSDSFSTKPADTMLTPQKTNHSPEHVALLSGLRSSPWNSLWIKACLWFTTDLFCSLRKGGEGHGIPSLTPSLQLVSDIATAFNVVLSTIAVTTTTKKKK